MCDAGNSRVAVGTRCRGKSELLGTNCSCKSVFEFLITWLVAEVKVNYLALVAEVKVILNFEF
jgi:hypothetical protein